MSTEMARVHHTLEVAVRLRALSLWKRVAWDEPAGFYFHHPRKMDNPKFSAKLRSTS